MEDHSVFYSRSLTGYPNYCRRLHFFNEAKDAVEAEFVKLLQEAAGDNEPERALRRKSRAFSARAYLGFCVIKPLEGSPVGRTVLRPYGPKADDGSLRVFDSTRLYQAHVAGLELTVAGLAFQQQDVGVSACATTALWSSLHKAKDLEDVGPATPAQITSLASRFSLPFGRSMPSEGLSVDQMCQAIRAFELAPHLLRPRSFQAARPLVYAAIRSGFAPILIIRRTTATSITTAHAVTATGVKLVEPTRPRFFAPNIWDYSQAMTALYVHDDRVGPYEKASVRDADGQLHLLMDEPTSAADEVTPKEDWTLTHILLPLHGKIRLSFSSLYNLLLRLTKKIGKRDDVGASIATEMFILKGPAYLRSLGLRGDSAALPGEIVKQLPLSRYVAVIRFRFSSDVTDVLIDTTSTEKNLHFLAVVTTSKASALASDLAQWCGCPLVM